MNPTSYAVVEKLLLLTGCRTKTSNIQGCFKNKNPEGGFKVAFT